MTPENRKRPTTAILVGLLILSLAFGLWTFSSLSSANKKVKQNTAAAKDALSKQKEAEQKYDDLLKQPYKKFVGPDNFGTVTFNYPKNWSAYIETADGNEPVNAYFYPDQVPSTQSDTAYPLRLELLNTDYASVVSGFSSQIAQGGLSSHAYIPPQLANNPSVQAGVRLDGIISQTATGTPLHGSMVIMKVRDKTLQIYTQANSNLSDFNNVVLNSLTFIP